LFILLSVGYFALLVGIVVVCFVVDPDSNSILGKLAYLCTISLPQSAKNAISRLPGGAKFVSLLETTANYVCYKPNPILQILYLLLVIGGFVIFNLEAMHHIPNQFLGEIHLYTSHLAVMITLFTFIKASTSDPGYITKNSFKVYDHYEYDGFLYVKRDCPTCKIRKIPRSKHCSVCNACISKFDHHCPWINGCVGEANYRWFLTFLCSTAILLLYSSYGVCLVLLDFIVSRNLFGRQFIHRETGERVNANLVVVFTFVFAEKSLLVMLGILSIIMAVVMIGFIGYHLYLIAIGTTTNESAKWGMIGSYYSKSPTFSGDRTKDLLDPDTMPALEKRTAAQFPETKPPNIYNLGIIGNYCHVFNPPSNYRQHLRRKKKKN